MLVADEAVAVTVDAEMIADEAVAVTAEYENVSNEVVAVTNEAVAMTADYEIVSSEHERKASGSGAVGTEAALIPGQFMRRRAVLVGMAWTRGRGGAFAVREGAEFSPIIFVEMDK